MCDNRVNKRARAKRERARAKRKGWIISSSERVEKNKIRQ